MDFNNSKWRITMPLRQFIFSIIYIVFMLFLLLWCKEHWNYTNSNGYEKIFPWIIVSMLVNLFGFIIVKKVSFCSFVFWFIMLSYLFMFGHIFLSVFQLKTTLIWNPAVFFSQSDKMRAAQYALMGLSSVSLGYFGSSFDKKKNKVVDNKSLNDENIAKLGWFFFWIGLTCNMIYSIGVISVTYFAGSYTAYLKAASTTGLLDDFRFLMIPGVTYLFSSRTLTKKAARNLLFFVVFYYTVTMVFSGSRKLQLFAIITVMVSYLWIINRKKIGIVKTFVFLIVGYVFLDLIYIIREYRTNLSRILPALLDSFTNFDFIHKLLGETFAESGLTMYSVAAIIENVPSVFPYECGMTFVRTLPSFLPIGWLVGDFFNKGYSTYVINGFTGVPVGASIIGDLYWNFGLGGGIIVCIILGIIFSRIEGMLDGDNEHEAMYFAIFYVMLIGIRAGFIEIFRPLVMVTLVPYVIKVILTKKI